MKTSSLGGFISILIFSSNCSAASSQASGQKEIKKFSPKFLKDQADKLLLPSPFPVYWLKDFGVFNQPYPGSIKILLPTNNKYKKFPGCYIACYSYSKGAYPISDNINVMGQIRVPGSYQKGLCSPKYYEYKNLASEECFKVLCSKKILSCKNNDCWAGGDTGGWFGIAPI